MRNRAGPTTELLPLASLQRLLAVLLMVIAPHLLRLPAWESLLVLALPLWRLLAARRHWPMPPWWLKLLLTLAVFAGVLASHGRVWGLQPGVALLTAMLALKLTELRARRDVIVTVFLLYFLLFTHFLYSQELWTLDLLLLAMLAITTVLIDVHHQGAARPLPLSLKKSALLLAQALPLMLLMFLLFPRLPGPLWSLPDDAGSGHSGLSDSMSPGDIASLALSDEIAFRVRFDTAEPAPAKRYWRGPLLADFDGRSWRAVSDGRRFELPDARLLGERVDYEVTQEASRAPWLFALDLADARQLPARSALTADYQLIASDPSRERRRYRLSSQLRYQLQTELPETVKARNLRLPARGNEQARALADQWRKQLGSDDAAILKAALQRFRQQAYVYTLQPPRLGRDSIDEFLFTTRRGFCEHYAGSFTFLMRAAGIPARVVTGYLGGEANPFGDWMVVRQSDAHAWSEVWLKDRGWVRVDPTAAVSPSRVEHNLSRALSERDGTLADPLLAWTALRYQLEAARDWVDARWSGLVLAYGDQQQRDFLSRWGLDDWQAMLLALTGAITAALAVIGLILARSSRQAPVDTAQRYWHQALLSLRRRGLAAQTGESPGDFAARVALTRPDLRAAMEQLTRAYLQLRYADDAEALPVLKQSLQQLRKQL